MKFYSILFTPFPSASFNLYFSARFRRRVFLSPSSFFALTVSPTTRRSMSFFWVIALPYDFLSISRESFLKIRSSSSLRAFPVNGSADKVTSGSVKNRRIAGYSLSVTVERAAQSSSHGIVRPIVKPRVLSRLK